MPAVLRSERKTIQRTVVQAMAVGVAGFERNPARKPLGQGCLQTVAVGTYRVLRLADERQIRELSGVGADAGDRLNHITVAAAAQSVAGIADMAALQRQVAAEGVL